MEQYESSVANHHSLAGNCNTFWLKDIGELGAGDGFCTSSGHALHRYRVGRHDASPSNAAQMAGVYVPVTGGNNRFHVALGWVSPR